MKNSIIKKVDYNQLREELYLLDQSVNTYIDYVLDELEKRDYGVYETGWPDKLIFKFDMPGSDIKFMRYNIQKDPIKEGIQPLYYCEDSCRFPITMKDIDDNGYMGFWKLLWKV